jgi:molybdopterin-synthase adenylyltransferase
MSECEESSTILLRSVHAIPDEDYIRTPEGSAWNHRFTAQVLSCAMKDRLGLLLIHSHPRSSSPTLSPVDFQSFRSLLARCIDLIPLRPHGSVVLGGDYEIGGSIWMPKPAPGRIERLSRVRWVGSPIIIRPHREVGRVPGMARYERQALLLGQHGQSLLYQSSLGIVGLGGGGSHVVQQAVHAGFGRLILIDPDTVEESNLSRMVGAGPADLGRSKVATMRDLAARIDPKVRTVGVEENFPSNQGLRALAQSDVIISCVDRFHSRKEVLAFAWRQLIPLIDIGVGTALSPGESPKSLLAVDGHCHVYLPGSACMWCGDFLNAGKLSREAGEKGPEYVLGAHNPSQVVSFNGILSSWALVEAMQIITGFLPPAPDGGSIAYRGTTRQVFTVSFTRRPGCETCASELGMGEPIW